MSGSRAPSTPPCSCRGLHINCEAAQCDQHQYVTHKEYEIMLRDLKNRANAGCTTCAILYDGLYVPEIKTVWQESFEEAELLGLVDPAIEKLKLEDTMMLCILPPNDTRSRVVIRTMATGNRISWRHFNFVSNSLPAAPAHRVFSMCEKHPIYRTDSEDAYLQLEQWIIECNTKHQCISAELTPLPKRVVDISNSKVRLRLCQDSEHARYTTLSHRWSSNESLVLRRNNVESLVSNIPWSELPKTMQDAIQISRHLGISFIWVDLLCIFQHDREDWLEQSRQMESIYGNSWLNIAAIDSKDSHGGCFRQTSMCERYPFYTIQEDPNIVVMQQPVLTHGDFGSNYDTTEDSPPLLQRGWVFQERLLAPRVIYYGKDELLWECKGFSDCQCGGTSVIARYKTYFHRSLASSGEPLSFVWMQVAQRYSGLSLTFDSDRSIALAGVARMARDSGRGGRYLAGLWSEDLAYQMCWSINDTWRKPKHYLAPSWSWLSVIGHVEFKRVEYKHMEPSQVEVQIIEAECHADPASDGLDSFTSGFVRLNGKLIEMDAKTELEPKSGRAHFTLHNHDKHLYCSGILSDYITTIEEADAICKVSILFWGIMWGTEATFMLLKPINQEKEQQSFERLGIFWLDKNESIDIITKLVNACNLRSDIYIW